MNVRSSKGNHIFVNVQNFFIDYDVGI